MTKDTEAVLTLAALGAAVFLVWQAFESGNSSAGGILGDAVADGQTFLTNTVGVPGSLAATIVDALAPQENVNPAHNNPGAICGSYDSNGNCLGPKTFATLADGEQAAADLVNKFLNANPGLTVQQFVSKWVTGNPAAPLTTALQNYLTGVENALGLGPNDPIANASGGGDADGGDGGDENFLGDDGDDE